MKGKSSFDVDHVVFLTFACTFGTLFPVTAFAYVGPGAGMTAIGTGLALIAALFLAIVGFIWYPLKRFFRKRKADTTDTGKALQDTGNAADSAADKE